MVVVLPKKVVTTDLGAPHSGKLQWWSGEGDDLRNSLTRQVTLPAEPATPRVTEHLEGCAHCRAEVADLRRVVELAREAGVDALVTPPPRVWRAIAAELGLPAADDAHDGAPSVPPDTGAPSAAPGTGAPPPAPVRAGSRRRR